MWDFVQDATKRKMTLVESFWNSNKLCSLVNNFASTLISYSSLFYYSFHKITLEEAA